MLTIIGKNRLHSVNSIDKKLNIPITIENYEIFESLETTTLHFCEI